eukprot:c6931_g1_i1.p1 GENE.c6931_g1_i1~~c6931_g1_i1.p1  ORF type:complete len:625 (+),score=126.78 c6931_g1_i1:256-1875(+)
MVCQAALPDSSSASDGKVEFAFPIVLVDPATTQRLFGLVVPRPNASFARVCILSRIDCPSFMLQLAQAANTVPSDKVLDLLQRVYHHKSRTDFVPKVPESITVVLDEILAPQPDTFTLTNNLDDDTDADAPLWMLMTYVTPISLIKLISSILLERRVIIRAGNLSVRILISFVTALAAAIAPFRWQYLLVPCLNEKLRDKILETQLPLLVGVLGNESLPPRAMVNSAVCDLSSGQMSGVNDLELIPIAHARSLFADLKYITAMQTKLGTLVSNPSATTPFLRCSLIRFFSGLFSKIPKCVFHRDETTIPDRCFSVLLSARSATTAALVLDEDSETTLSDAPKLPQRSYTAIDLNSRTQTNVSTIRQFFPPRNITIDPLEFDDALLVTDLDTPDVHFFMSQVCQSFLFEALEFWYLLSRRYRVTTAFDKAIGLLQGNAGERAQQLLWDLSRPPVPIHFKPSARPRRETTSQVPMNSPRSRVPPLALRHSNLGFHDLHQQHSPSVFEPERCQSARRCVAPGVSGEMPTLGECLTSRDRFRR